MIKVKPLVWEKDPNDDNIWINQYKFNFIEYFDNYDEFIIFNYGFDEIKAVNVLEEAKNYVQQLWNEYILSLIEVEE